MSDQTLHPPQFSEPKVIMIEERELESLRARLREAKIERDEAWAACVGMRAALHSARLAIKALHGPVAWPIYEIHSPEMKLIDAALSRTLGADVSAVIEAAREFTKNAESVNDEYGERLLDALAKLDGKEA